MPPPALRAPRNLKDSVQGLLAGQPKGARLRQTDRLYHIHRILRARRQPVPRATLAAELEVSPATVKRDINRLRDMGAPIPMGHPAGYFYDPEAPAFELPGLWFNQSELYALLATEQLLEAVQPGVLNPQLGRLKGRVRQLLGTGDCGDRGRLPDHGNLHLPLPPTAVVGGHTGLRRDDSDAGYRGIPGVSTVVCAGWSPAASRAEGGLAGNLNAGKAGDTACEGALVLSGLII